MKKLSVLIVTICLSIFAATLVIASSDSPSELQYPSKMGTVTFNHANHESLIDCASCHDVVQGIDKKEQKEAFHGLCISCHKEQKQGPTNCRECHVKE